MEQTKAHFDVVLSIVSGRIAPNIKPGDPDISDDDHARQHPMDDIQSACASVFRRPVFTHQLILVLPLLESYFKHRYTQFKNIGDFPIKSYDLYRTWRREKQELLSLPDWFDLPQMKEGELLRLPMEFIEADGSTIYVEK